MPKKKTWRDNPARAIILSDLEEGRVPLNEDAMSAEVTFNEFYGDNGIVQAVGFEGFEARLKAHREQVMRRLQKGPKKSKFWWRTSEAKCLVIEDLTRGILSLEEDATKPKKKWESYYKDLPENKDVAFETFKEDLEKNAMTAEQAWETHYKKLPAFKEVEFSKFKARLKDHCKQVKQYLMRSKKEEWMLEQDRKRYPKKSRKADGKLRWDTHPAKMMLREDVAEKKHKQVTPTQLRASKDEYKELDLDVFRPHIYQENRRRRFCNHLNNRREKKKIIHCCKRPVDPKEDNTWTQRLNALDLNEPENIEDALDEDQDLMDVEESDEESDEESLDESCAPPPNKKQKQN